MASLFSSKITGDEGKEGKSTKTGDLFKAMFQKPGEEGKPPAHTKPADIIRNRGGG